MRTAGACFKAHYYHIISYIVVENLKNRAKEAEVKGKEGEKEDRDRKAPIFLLLFLLPLQVELAFG